MIVEEVEVESPVGVGDGAGAAKDTFDFQQKSKHFAGAKLAFDSDDRVDEPRLVGNRDRSRAPPRRTSYNFHACPAERGERGAASGARRPKDGRNIRADAEKYQTIIP